jgi:hypothetical protein
MRILATISCALLANALISGCALVSTAPRLDTKRIKTTPIIVDHTCVDLQQVPLTSIRKARQEFGIAYGHTSHGSQLVSGMQELMQKDDRFAFDTFGSSTALSLFDRDPSGDLGDPNRSEWARRTRFMLDKGWGDVNIVMWSWCG